MAGTIDNTSGNTPIGGTPPKDSLVGLFRMLMFLNVISIIAVIGIVGLFAFINITTVTKVDESLDETHDLLEQMEQREKERQIRSKIIVDNVTELIKNNVENSRNNSKMIQSSIATSNENGRQIENAINITKTLTTMINEEMKQIDTLKQLLVNNTLEDEEDEMAVTLLHNHMRNVTSMLKETHP